ncbi:hypothetical protein PMAYCL1PPCAC_33232, partial [Pristionchus mayeri]
FRCPLNFSSSFSFSSASLLSSRLRCIPMDLITVMAITTEDTVTDTIIPSDTATIEEVTATLLECSLACCSVDK